MTAKASTLAKQKYNDKTYDQVRFVVRKDGTINKDAIQAAAAKVGESVNEFILKAVSDRITNEVTKAPTAPTEPAAESAEPDGGGVSRKHK